MKLFFLMFVGVFLLLNMNKGNILFLLKVIPI